MRTFKKLDTNGDGQLDRDELKKGNFNKLFKCETYSQIAYESHGALNEDDFTNLMEKLDNDKSGAIDYSGIAYPSIDRI